MGYILTMILSSSGALMNSVISDEGYSLYSGFQNVGRGIGSIFLLFVIFQCVSSILDGGKFQAKMLLPLLIYLLVCNFSWVSSPMLRFASAIGGACSTGTEAHRQNKLKDISGGKECTNIFDAFMARAEMDKSESDKEMEDEMINEEEPDEEGKEQQKSGEDLKGKKKKGIIGNLVQNIFIVIKNSFRWAVRMLGDFLKLSNDDGAYRRISWGLPGFIALILQWVTLAVSLAMKSIGTVMIMIVVAFGPLTWAFAIFPGNTRVLGSWAIRICQFSLYGPICCLIDSFSTSLCFDIGTAMSQHAGWNSVLPLLGVLIANIVALTSVPSIASMVIEGASGSISLTSGFQHMASALGVAGAVMSAPVRIPYGAAKKGWGIAQSVASFGANASQLGERRRDSEQVAYLEAIARKLAPEYLSDKDGPNGTNPRK